MECVLEELLNRRKEGFKGMFGMEKLQRWTSNPYRDVKQTRDDLRLLSQRIPGEIILES